MSCFNRREFLHAAAAMGATLLLPGVVAARELRTWSERRDLYPEGVASGDPDAHSVLLWTRRPYSDGRQKATLLVEVARDAQFQHRLSVSHTTVAAVNDWTCRVLAADLSPNTRYWYRFTDEEGAGSRIGQTRTAPAEDDPRPVSFAFVSCQNVNQGAQNAFRRMIWDDDRAAEADRLGFVLHLGDFIYELVWYPEDRKQGMYDRRLRDIVRYPSGERVEDFHIPTTTEDYRAVYRAYLHDPDIQAARARFPFVCMWDNHEFSWLGWQGVQVFGGVNRPAQTRKVAANQAWFEYQPARVGRPGRPLRESFHPPVVHDVALTRFDEHGLGLDPDNLTAIHSLTGYRSHQWGQHLELFLTDQHSYRSEDLSSREEVQLPGRDFLDFYPEEAMTILDAGRTYAHGNPPASIRFGDTETPNIARAAPAQTILGAEQKAWFRERLQQCRKTWKIWGNTEGTLDFRVDPQNLPVGLTKPWPGTGYACFGGGDASTAYLERAEIYDLVQSEKLTGFVTVAGDRHSFWAGYAAKALPPTGYDPVGLAFITGSISAPGLVEAIEHRMPKDHPLRALYLADRPGLDKPEALINLTLRHGVRSALEYSANRKLPDALALSNRDLSPHLDFIDMGGHGYAVVRASAERIATEFVCIPRPLERSTTDDGGPLRYRVRFEAQKWGPGERPVMQHVLLEGDSALSAV
jgi:alkaline phosphatase D